MKLKISLSFARLLKSLSMGEEVNAGLFSASNKKLLDLFLKDGVLDFRLIGSQQKKIFCRDMVNLSSYLHNKFGIPSLDEYITYLELEDAERSELFFNSDIRKGEGLVRMRISSI